MARGQMRLRKRSILSSQEKGKKDRTVQAKFNAIQRDSNQNTAMSKDCALVRHGNILQRIMERDARPQVAERDNRGQKQEPVKSQYPSTSGSPIIQRKIDANNLAQLVEQQISQQADFKANGIQDGKTYTTVGFEHEFAQMKDGPLRGLDHVEIGESTEHMPFTGINFKLETDADNALELVSPPFLIETIAPGSSIPIPEDVAKINRLISMDLQGAVNPEDRTIAELVSTMKGSSNITFNLKRRPDLGSEQRTPGNTRRSNAFKRFFHSWSSFKFGNPLKGNKFITKVDKIPQIHLKPAIKNGGILPQANVALSGKDLAKVIEKTSAPNVAISSKISAFGKLQMGIKAKLIEKGNLLTNNQLSSELQTFLNQLARTLSGIVSVPFQGRQLAAQGKATKMFGHWKQYWKGYTSEEQEQKKEEARDRQPQWMQNWDWYQQILDNKAADRKKWLKKYREMELLTSHVKDVQDLWVKDTLMNIGLGLSLTPQDWDTVKNILLDEEIQGMLSGIEQNDAMSALRTEYPWAFSKNRGIGPKMVAGANKIISQIQNHQLDTTAPDENLDFGVDKQRSFLSHKSNYVSPRQDTFLKRGTVKLPGSGNRAHVLESRRDVNTFLGTLKDIRSEQVPVNNQLQPPRRGFRGRGYNKRSNPQESAIKLNELQKNHPVNSLIRYRVANNVERSKHFGGPVDIDCLARVTGHGYNQSHEPALEAIGIAFVNSKTLNTLSHSSTSHQEWVSEYVFNLNDIASDHIGAITLITKDEVVV